MAVASVGLQLVVTYALVTFTLRRFPYTRPWGETLRESMLSTVGGIGLGMLHALPSLFTVLVIVIIARAVTLLLEPWFAAVERGAIFVPWMHAETTATTRRLVNGAVWLFAAAMAYPYVPGSDTDAFRGISVAVGLMVTLGSSGLVNQVMSGFVLTYSRAIRLGDFVRIGDVEGTITQIGMLSTKLRTLRAEEVTIPNTVVVSQTTTDYSRFPDAVLTATSVTVGYAVPWRQVHALLQMAAERTPGIRKDPPPRVLQAGLRGCPCEYTLSGGIDWFHVPPAQRSCLPLRHKNGTIYSTFWDLMKALFRALLLLVVLLLVGGGLAAYSILSRGLSTRVPPSWIEATLARTMRRAATPRLLRDAKNPVQASADVMEEALAHFADHCASCHGNDGSGNTDIGRSFYPPVPDMRAATTQGLTDGELFAIVENGIRLTGMPAWGTGTPEGERQSWALVHFIRRLPTLTPDDVAKMEELNPKSPDQFREEEEIRKFLAGEDQNSTQPAGPAPPHKHD